MYSVIAFYKFAALASENLESLKLQITELAESLSVRGLLLLSPEGFNATLSGEEDKLIEFRSRLELILPMTDLMIKFSTSEFMPFKEIQS